MPPSIAQLVASPACIPQWPLDQILPAYAQLGFTQFEAFCTWCKSALDIHTPPQHHLDIAAAHNIHFTSMHLPPITDDFDASLAAAIDTARYAAAIGATAVIYKANTIANYIRGSQPFLDALQSQSIPVTPVLQNHKGTAITTLDDYHAVIEGIADPRMKTLLEVGHFQRVGTHWRDGCNLLGDSIALVHINDINDAGQSVVFGTGNVDFAGLFRHLDDIHYTGRIIVELELVTRDTDAQRTLTGLRESLAHLHSLGLED